MNTKTIPVFLVFSLVFWWADLALGNQGSTPPGVHAGGNQAWFLDRSVEPKGKEIEGLALSAISKDWDLATLLSPDLVPSEAKKDFELEHLSFSLDISYPGENYSDRALTGVYKKKDGEVGRFLLILRKSNGNQWKKSFLLEEPFSPGFSFLNINGRRLIWSDCYKCDSFIEVEWIDGSFQIRVISVGK